MKIAILFPFLVEVMSASSAGSGIVFSAEGLDSEATSSSTSELPLVGASSTSTHPKKLRFCANGNASETDLPWSYVGGWLARIVPGILYEFLFASTIPSSEVASSDVRSS